MYFTPNDCTNWKSFQNPHRLSNQYACSNCCNTDAHHKSYLITTDFITQCIT